MSANLRLSFVNTKELRENLHYVTNFSTISLFLIAVSFFESLRLPLAKGSSTSNQAFSIVFTTPSVPLVGDRNLRRKDVTALLGARNRCALRLADHQRSSLDCAGWDRRGTTYYNLLVETTIFVPHRSIALRLSSLEWGCYLTFCLLQAQNKIICCMFCYNIDRKPTLA